VGRPRTIDHDRAQALRAQGHSNVQIAKILGCSVGSVSYATNERSRQTTIARVKRNARARRLAGE
jgi:predicted transcriptional regulator